MASIPKAVVSESNGEVSCSVEETNRIRAAIGLAPLRVSTAPKRDLAAEQRAADERKASVAAELAARVQRSKEKRALHARLKGKTLGQQCADAKAMSASDWVRYVIGI